MAKKERPFFKVKQVCLTGLTLRMFEYDVEQNEIRESTLIRDILKEHYRLNPPLGFFKENSR